MITECYICKRAIDRQPSWIGKRNFCNKNCYIEFQKTLKGEQTNRWKGGPPQVACKICGNPCKQHHRPYKPIYCSIKCSVKDRSGENHWNWKGGKDTRYLRKIAPRPRPDICEVCDKPGKKRNGITIDHNHKTGKFRGWLCSNCNTTIGLVQENPEILQALIKYLKVNENSL